MKTYTSILLTVLAVLADSIFIAAGAPGPTQNGGMALLAILSLGGIIYYSFKELKNQIKLCFSLVIFCLLLAVFSAWAEADIYKTINSQELRQTLTDTLGSEATSTFYINQNILALSFYAYKVSAMLEAFILALYAAVLTTLPSRK